MFIKHKNPVGRQIAITRDGVPGKEIVHRFIELNAQGRTLMVEQEVNPGIAFLAQADFDIFRHFEQWMEVA